MPSQLISAKLRGVRSYSPREDATQVIDFMPLTLIVGKNGTGKTTIIESLKFIIAGEEPPNSDSRRNFIHTPKEEQKRAIQANDHNYACIEIEFRNASGQICIARREISPAGSISKNSTPAITSGYKVNKGSWTTVNRQDDWSKVLPRLFGLPNQSILSHVILCHQEDNLWCMSDSANVKQIFDKIFGCEQYKKEIKYIEDEIRSCKRDIQMSEKDIQLHQEKVERKKSMAKDIERLRTELKENQTKTNALDAEIQELSAKRIGITEALSEIDTSSRQIISLTQRVRELTERDNVLRRSLQPFLDRSGSCVPERRSHPPPQPPPSRPKKKNKPEQDITTVELDCVSSKIKEMTKVVDALPYSKDLDVLKSLIVEVDSKIREIKQRFCLHPEEDEDENIEELQRKWYEEQEAASRAAEVRRQEEEKKIRESIESSIKENLKNLEEVKEQLVKLETKTRSLADCAEAKQNELKDLDRSLLSARDRRSMLSGSSMQMEREIKKLEADSRNYWQASTNLAESFGRLVCNKTILKDLEKLKICFQESISSFHDQMIIKINEALRSRWRQIYQGGDIDTVEVVAEEITRGKDKKSFNYYMAIRKGGSRMKMREKSSAGQRALASIILRMTLAELFVRDFTFIALDEPTANLDISNVQALAKSIGSYVSRRTKRGANIQWIIITHDEEFLRALDEESSPFFYRVLLNGNGYSEIVKVNSSEKNCCGEILTQD